MDPLLYEPTYDSDGELVPPTRTELARIREHEYLYAPSRSPSPAPFPGEIDATVRRLQDRGLEDSEWERAYAAYKAHWEHGHVHGHDHDHPDVFRKQRDSDKRLRDAIQDMEAARVPIKPYELLKRWASDVASFCEYGNLCHLCKCLGDNQRPCMTCATKDFTSGGDWEERLRSLMNFAPRSRHSKSTTHA